MKRDTTLSAVLKDKQALREHTTAEPFAEKLRILEQIRNRDAAIRGSASSKKLPRGR